MNKLNMHMDLLKQKQINTFSAALRKKLLDRESRFGKEYLILLVNETKIERNEAQIPGD